MASMVRITDIPDLDVNPADYKILKRMPLSELEAGQSALLKDVNSISSGIKRIITLDFEATSLDPHQAEPIEIGMTELLFEKNHGIFAVNGIFSELNDPGIALEPIITEVTGLTNDDLAGHQFDHEKIARFITCDGKDLNPVIIAHNAAYDKTIFERRFPELAGLPWVCSVNDCDWSRQTSGSRGQENLLRELGYFYDAHRASTDTLALSWLLHKSPDRLNELLNASTLPMYRVNAVNFPFDGKDALKAQKSPRYSWDALNKVWWCSVRGNEKVEQQVELLKVLAYEFNGVCSPVVTEMPSKSRGEALSADFYHSTIDLPPLSSKRL